MTDQPADKSANGKTVPKQDDDAKASRIKARISASQARNRGDAPPRKAAKASPAPRKKADQRGLLERALDDHPLALLAGSLVLGAVAASLVPASVGRKLGRRVFGLAALAGELGVLYGGRALDAGAGAARSGQGRLEDLGQAVAGQGTAARRKAAGLGALAGRRALELAQEAVDNARNAQGGALKRLAGLADRVRH